MSIEEIGIMQMTKTKNMKTHTLLNDNTIGYYLVKYMIEKANNTSMELFIAWFVDKIIFPYKKEDKIIEEITERIGFKKVPTMDKIYFRLKEIQNN